MDTEWQRKVKDGGHDPKSTAICHKCNTRWLPKRMEQAEAERFRMQRDHDLRNRHETPAQIACEKCGSANTLYYNLQKETKKDIGNPETYKRDGGKRLSSCKCLDCDHRWQQRSSHADETLEALEETVGT